MKSITELPIKERLPLWAERWGKDKLIQRKAEIGETAYNRGFRNIPAADKDLLFKRIGDCIVYEKDWKKYIQHDGFPRYSGVDLSSKTRPGNVIFTFGIIPDTLKRVVIDVRYGDWTSNQTAEQISAVHALYHSWFIAVEDNAYQGAIIEWMQTGGYAQVPVIPHHTGSNKSDPVLGLPQLALEVEKGMWIIPMDKEHEPDCKCGICHWIREAKAYPLGATSDSIMAWWFAQRAFLERGGGSSGIKMRSGDETVAGQIIGENF